MATTIAVGINGADAPGLKGQELQEEHPQVAPAMKLYYRSKMG